MDGIPSPLGSASSASDITSVSSSRAGTHVSDNDCECEFMEHEKGVRLLTASLTFKEADVLRNLASCNANRLRVITTFGLERSVATHTVLREWALELSGHGEYTTGYCVPIGDPLWSLCKGMMLCERSATTTQPVGCHCLNKSYFMVLGCYHLNLGEPSLQEPGDCMECQRCLRCNGYPGPILECNALNATFAYPTLLQW